MTCPDDVLVDVVSFSSPPYQSEVVIPPTGGPPGLDVLSGLWDRVSRSPPTRDRVNPLSTMADMMNWNDHSTSTSTSSAGMVLSPAVSTGSPSKTASSESSSRSLWDGHWLTEPRPTSNYGTSGLPPLRLVLIKTVGTDNIWSSRPAVDPSPWRGSAGSRDLMTTGTGSRPLHDVCGSVSESALSDLTRWTELTGHRHHLTTKHNVNPVTLSTSHSFQPTVLTVALMLQCCVRLSVCL